MPNVLALRREEVYRLLRNDILSCALFPGQSLHEIDLAERFGLSKSPIRDALIRLEGDRLVTVTPRKGYRVAPVSLADAEELFQFRSMVEEAAVRLASTYCSPRELDQLNSFRDLKAWGGKGGFVAYNRAFHVALANLSRTGALPPPPRISSSNSIVWSLSAYLRSTIAISMGSSKSTARSSKPCRRVKAAVPLASSANISRVRENA